MITIEHLEEDSNSKILYKYLIFKLEGDTFEERLKDFNNFIRIWVEKDLEHVMSFEFHGEDELVIKKAYELK